MARVLYVPYANQCCWWAPVELIRRGLFIVLLVIVPRNLVSWSVTCACYLLFIFQALLLLPMMGLLAVHTFIKPYKLFYVNLLESALLTNVLLLFLIASTDYFKVVFSVWLWQIIFTGIIRICCVLLHNWPYNTLTSLQNVTHFLIFNANATVF